MRRGRVRKLALILILAVAAGCGEGDGLGRRPVSAAVTLDGKPLASGTMMLEPTFPEGGTMVGGNVRNGKFALDRSSGPVPGPYLVRIYASSKVQAAPLPGKSERSARPLVELIPERFNSRTTLDAVVKADGDNHFRFDLSSDMNEIKSP